MQVFILAAGIGSRLKKITKYTPKPLIKIGRKTIIEYLLGFLADLSAVDEIHIVVGYKREKFIHKIGNKINNIPIYYHFNAKYKEPGNTYSLYTAKKSMKDDIIFMTADLIIDPILLKLFINEGPGNKILLDNRKKCFKKDTVKVSIINNKISDISKALPVKKTDGAGVGLYRMDKTGIYRYFQIAEEMFNNNEFQFGFVEPIRRMKDKPIFSGSFYSNYKWFDVDTYKDLEKAKKEVGLLYGFP